MNLKNLLDIEFPIIQGGMANIATGEFAAAVSNSGGLGIIATGGLNTEQLKEEIRKCKSLTDKPFGVNLMLLNPCIDEIAIMIIEEGVKIITTGAGNPGKYISKWKEENMIIIPVVPSVALARRMEKLGATAIIAEGTESGGHVGELTTMTLLPQVINAVNIPVIAAGGIASGSQFAAAISLGACGVQVGTCLLVSTECPIHENYKEAILKAKDTGTIVTGRNVGVPVRALKNYMTREYVKIEKTTNDKMELEKYTLGSLRKAVFDGDIKMGSMMAGQVSGQLTEIKPIRDILTEIYYGGYEVIKNIGAYYEN